MWWLQPANEKDEGGVLTALKGRRRDTLKPLVPQHHGRIVKLIGDGVLVEFASAANTVNCDPVGRSNERHQRGDSQGPTDRTTAGDQSRRCYA
jgi:class 3 adenylate cyclase